MQDRVFTMSCATAQVDMLTRYCSRCEGDEGKPRCQNCIDKNFECQYGLQVTFLPKNSITVNASELCTPDTDEKYQIQFVKEDPVAYNTDGSAEDSPSPTLIASSAPLPIPSADDRPDSHEDYGGSAFRLDNHHNPGGLYVDADDPALPQWIPNNEDPQKQDVYPVPKTATGNTPFSDKDESAVRGLLALGSSASLNDICTVPELRQNSALPRSSMDIRNGGSPGIQSTFMGEMGLAPAGAQLSPSTTAAPSLVPEARKLELLRHYRYYVAPWLDICDMKHPFGISVVQIAVKSEDLLHALMELSNVCIIPLAINGRERHSRPSFSARPDRLPLNRQGTGLDLNSTEMSLLVLFDQLRSLISEFPNTWNNTAYGDLRLLESLAPHAFGMEIESSVYWMFLRLDLSIALANNMSIRTPLPTSAVPSPSLLSRTEDVHERVRHYTHVVLWLCGKVLSVCHQESMAQEDSSHQQLTDSWVQIFNELDQWFHMRPQELRPMVELNTGDQVLSAGTEFPLLLFANTAGALGNQIYHTAMLLLLQSKPRTALLDKQHSPALSPLWHAQRVCGIALNNDRRECWDPSLLASFLVAARYMTHESQQKEILQGFDRIHNLTGWDAGEYLSHLREDWSFLEGT
ncbi:hypothetical protein FE257_006020 [Aspergillus nanangensis]|uniref:Zn(2)-C6 fungal-type domain-containing protein n=1 Tax=Aspergillus nanangensis TaxID=2582783 RepID=A0AAD4GU80_ASPNN|nr:hypothetical protein FE257_006020 [Aspergillus nanangensis]